MHVYDQPLAIPEMHIQLSTSYGFCESGGWPVSLGGGVDSVVDTSHLVWKHSNHHSQFLYGPYLTQQVKCLVQTHMSICHMSAMFRLKVNHDGI